MNIDRNLLIEQTNNILIGTYDFKDLAKQAVGLIVNKLRHEFLIGAAIFRVHELEQILYAYTYATKHKKMIDALLPVSFSRLSIHLSQTDNLAVRAVTSNQIQQSSKLSDFSKGVLPQELTDKTQSLMGGKLAVGLPIRVRNGKVAGVLLLMLKENSLSGEQLVLFETLAKQLGLAFINVNEFEKLSNKYRNVLSKEMLKNDDEIANLKFTLRITKNQNEKLQTLAKQNKKNKAEILREIIDKT